MSHILCIETTGKTCSVAVQQGNGEVFTILEGGEQFIHAESLHPFIQSVLEQAGLRPDELRAIAVSAGPGSYTGLRIGIAAAKGMAFSLDIPLIAIGTLELMAKAVIRNYPGYETYVPMLDARRMEVYTQTFTSAAESLDEAVPVIVDAEFFPSKPGASLVYFGDGAGKCAHLATRRDVFIPDIHPLASGMIEIAEQLFIERKFANLAYFEPMYLKEFIAGPKAG